MQPRSDGLQRCLHFALTTAPPARVMMYQDHDGNTVHHFNIPARHSRLTLTADALVDCDVPQADSAPRRARRLGAARCAGGVGRVVGVDRAEPVHPRHAAARRVCPRAVPGTGPRSARRAAPRHERDLHALRIQAAEHARRLADRRGAEARCGVCQDFAHIFIALMRPLGIPYALRQRLSVPRPGQRRPDRRKAPAMRGRSRSCRAWAGSASTRRTTWIVEARHIRVADRTRLRRRAADARRLQRRDRGQKRAGGGGARRSRHLAAGRRRPAVHPMDVARRRRADLESRDGRHPSRTSSSNGSTDGARR